MATKDNRKRVLLDTNVWRYVIDGQAQSKLLRITREGPCDVQIAPAVVYETLRLKNGPLRLQIIRLMTNPCFQRLMPEAYSESMEILTHIKAVRPDWLRPLPNLTLFKRLENDWRRRMGGFWVRCKASAVAEARAIAEMDGGLMESARRQSHLAREEIIAAKWKRNPPMDKTLGALPYPIPGWNGAPVEVWRIDSLSALTYALASPGNPYRDWVLPFIELDDGLLHSPSWTEFWLHLADKSSLPRQWMRWGFSFCQRFRKTTPGSPGDIQLSTYFLDTDLVITADKALIDILDECRPFAPCPLPKGKCIPAGNAGLDCLFQTLGG